MSRKSGPEARLQKWVLDSLEESGLIFWRQNSGSAFIAGRKIGSGPPGMPDVMILRPDGVLFGLELKAPGGTVRPTQAEMQLKWSKKTLARYCIAWDKRQVTELIIRELQACHPEHLWNKDDSTSLGNQQQADLTRSALHFWKNTSVHLMTQALQNESTAASSAASSRSAGKKRTAAASSEPSATTAKRARATSSGTSLARTKKASPSPTGSKKTPRKKAAAASTTPRAKKVSAS